MGKNAISIVYSYTTAIPPAKGTNTLKNRFDLATQKSKNKTCCLWRIDITTPHPQFSSVYFFLPSAFAFAKKKNNQNTPSFPQLLPKPKTNPARPRFLAPQEPGFTSSSSRPMEIYKCASSEACPGGAAGSCAGGREGLACVPVRLADGSGGRMGRLPDFF